MRTAISLPDEDFDRFERVAARNGMNRSEFYRRAADRLARELEDETDLTALANAVIARLGQPSGDGAFLRANERAAFGSTEW